MESTQDVKLWQSIKEEITARIKNARKFCTFTRNILWKWGLLTTNYMRNMKYGHNIKISNLDIIYFSKGGTLKSVIL